MADELFADDTFILLTKDKALKEKTEEQISESGGAVARSITKRVTVVVVDKDTDFPEDIKKADTLKVPVVSFSFIEKSISGKAREKPENHKVTAASAASGDDAGPSAKKAKVDDATSGGLQKDNEWMGVSIASDASTYPFVLEITGVDGENFTGTIKWPTLGGAVTKVKGSLKGDTIKWEEYEAISGADEVELPMFYDGKLAGDKITGKLKDSAGEESKFNLSKIKTKSGVSAPVVPAKDLSKYKGLPSLKEKASFKGVLTLDYDFSVKVTSLNSEGKIEGIVNWPSVGAETSFVGTVNDVDLTFEEVKILKGDGIEIPVKYEGKIDEAAKSVGGNYTAASSKGTFVLVEATK